MMNPRIGAEHYEALRGHVREGTGRLGSAPLGAVLVVKMGVAGWMRHWTQISAATLAVPPVTPVTSEPGWQRELTVVLAAMTASHLKAS